MILRMEIVNVMVINAAPIKGKVDISIANYINMYTTSYYASIVHDVLNNYYGTGIHRKNALYAQGINYWYVQNLVNKSLRKG